MDRNNLFLRAVAQYLKRAGFPRALTMFCKKANLQKDDLGAASFDLQDIFFKYLEKSDLYAKILESNSVLDSNTDIPGNMSVEVTKEAVNSKKKKRSDKSDEKAAKVVDSKVSEETVTNDVVAVEVKPKEKTKRKSKDKEINKKDSDSSGHTLELVEEPAKDVVAVEVKPKEKTKKKSKDKGINKKDSDSTGHILELVEEPAKDVVDDSANPKPKKKKNKKEKNVMDSEAVNGKKDKSDTTGQPESDTANKKNETSQEDVIPENKDSKKRKRSPSEDVATQLDHEKAADESKRRKTDASKNGLDLVDKVEKKSAKKNEQNGSVEPFPNRFQRVKVDDVVFTDERLKDNSYWAKDGAENGYGAKAQEVLGQVRGRDFRHEKTKKKRGSYRGGQIDLQSHSIKFTFPDDA